MTYPETMDAKRNIATECPVCASQGIECVTPGGERTHKNGQPVKTHRPRIRRAERTWRKAVAS